MSTSVPEARSVVSRYLAVLYNQRRLDLIAELISDPTRRHTAGEAKCLTIAETVDRLQSTLDLCPEVFFDSMVMHDDGTMVTVNWNGRSTQHDGRPYEYCGIEVFRVVDGKIVEIWNSRETGGHWQTSRTF
jgi:ketosteroid isomerase-like protein